MPKNFSLIRLNLQATPEKNLKTLYRLLFKTKLFFLKVLTVVKRVKRGQGDRQNTPFKKLSVFL